MTRRVLDRNDLILIKQENLRDAEARGLVADSMDYRLDLIARFKGGEITFDEMQAELKATKRNAKKNGKITRAQAYKF